MSCGHREAPCFSHQTGTLGRGRGKARPERLRREEGSQEPEMKDNSWAGRGPPSPASANVWSDVGTEPGSQETGPAGCVTPDKPHHDSETQLSHL